MTKFQKFQMRLAASRVGRITLHLFCIFCGASIAAHWAGIVREF